MKRFTSLLCALGVVTAMHAQLGSDGFYRVQNTETGNYITVVSDQVSGNQANPDFSASLHTVSGFENVVSDPGSVIYFKSAGVMAYDLLAQGVNTYNLAQGYHLNIAYGTIDPSESGGSYSYFAYAKATSMAIAKYLADNGSYVNTTSGDREWFIWPVDDGDCYFGLTPTVDATDGYYSTLYASFAFTPSSSMTVYAISEIRDGMAVVKEIEGKVAPGTPVLVKCSSSSPSGNKLSLSLDGGNAPSVNLLNGGYFENRIVNDPNTMRVLGTAPDGSAAFVKSSQSYIERNTAYLVVPAGSPDVIKVVNSDADINAPVTVTATSYSREYGAQNPTFEYTKDGGTLVGNPLITCGATPASPVGTYPIQISKGSLTNTNVTYVDGTLTINRAKVYVTASSHERFVGDENPTFTVTYSGFKNGEDESVLKALPTVSCDATAESPAGSYVISVSGAVADNYEFVYTSGTLTVRAAELTAKSYTRVYGDPNPTFEYTPTSLFGDDEQPAITCEATATSPVGVYPIVLSQGTITRTVTLNNGSLTITKAPLKISVQSAVKKQGQENPEFVLVYEGFKNNENADVLTTQPTVTCVATKESAPGEYDVTISGAEATNYEITYESGKLTVTEADAVAVIANDFEREYGEENPQFDFRVSGAEIEGQPEITCEAGKDSPVGTYPIVVSKGTVSNYNVSYVPGTLTIKKAKLEVGVKDCERVEGQENPVFELTYSGWKNNDTESVLTVVPTATTAATAASPAGEYEITVSGGEAQNYEFAYTNGKLTVTVDNAIGSVSVFGTSEVNVYTTTGILVKKNATDLKGLAKGVYIVNGKKIVLK